MVRENCLNNAKTDIIKNQLLETMVTDLTCPVQPGS